MQKCEESEVWGVRLRVHVNMIVFVHSEVNMSVSRYDSECAPVQVWE